MPVHDAVLVKVISAKPILSPAYTFIPGTTEAKLRDIYAAKYGMAVLAHDENAQ